MQASVRAVEPADAAAPRPRRILLVGKGPPDRGGIAGFLVNLVEGPLGQSHDLRLLNLYQVGDRNGGRLSMANAARTIGDARRVFRHAKDAELVHIHTALVPLVTLFRAGLLALAARRAGAHVVVHVHSGMVEWWLRGRVRPRAARWLLAAADRVVTVSQGSYIALRRALPGGRVRLIVNGVDLNAYGRSPAHDPVRILFAGVLTARKGVVDLLRASQLLRQRGSDHELVIAGGTPEEGGLLEAEVRAAARQLAPAARFIGTRAHHEMPALYLEADVFCLPSWWEAMPLTILEAMASGLPVVATSVGDIPQMVEDGVTGRLVPPHQPEALAEALECLIRDPGMRRAMGARAQQEVATRFPFDETCAALDGIYRELVP